MVIETTKPDTITAQEAAEYELAHPCTEPTEVYYKCDECGYEDSFTGGSHWGPVGESEDLNDYCPACRKTVYGTIVKVVCNGKEVVY